MGPTLHAQLGKPFLPSVMGVINVTPDSFYDGGCFFDPQKALNHAQAMIQQGADIIDIGGESSRPGAQTISVDEELSRVIPVIEGIRAFCDIEISIDTCKPAVMLEAIKAGASLINDINALQAPGALELLSTREDVSICLMHMQGVPVSMQDNPYYTYPVVDEINDFFHERIAACVDAGIRRNRLILDPGVGFGKTIQHNLQIIKELSAFQQHGLPVLLGVSRKSFIGEVLNQPPAERLYGSLAIAGYTALKGVSIIRTHDVAETKQLLTMIAAIENC